MAEVCKIRARVNGNVEVIAAPILNPTADDRCLECGEPIGPTSCGGFPGLRHVWIVDIDREPEPPLNHRFRPAWVEWRRRVGDRRF